MGMFLSGMFWVVGLMVVTAVVAVLLRKLGERDGSDGRNEIAGQVFTIVGGVNVVIAAFVLISLFDAADQAEETAYKESNALIAVQWAGDALPEPSRSRVQQLTRTYATEVAEREWPDLEAGRTVGGRGWQLLDQLQHTVAQATATTERQEDSRLEAAVQVRSLYEARQERLNFGGSGVTDVVWFAILVGSVMSVALMFLFGGGGLVSYALIVSMLSGAIGLLLFAIYQLQNPFTGGAGVGPDAFVAALTRMTQGG